MDSNRSPYCNSLLGEGGSSSSSMVCRSPPADHWQSSVLVAWAPRFVVRRTTGLFPGCLSGEALAEADAVTPFTSNL
jgi:hypothetical protein